MEYHNNPASKELDLNLEDVRFLLESNYRHLLDYYYRMNSVRQFRICAERLIDNMPVHEETYLQLCLLSFVAQVRMPRRRNKIQATYRDVMTTHQYRDYIALL